MARPVQQDQIQSRATSRTTVASGALSGGATSSKEKDMSELDTIVVLHTTSWEDNAQTNANFQLEIDTSEDRVIKAFENLPHDEREPGQTDIYQFDVRGDKIDTKDPGLLITMRMVDSQDGWLPMSIFVLGKTSTGEFIVLGANPEWSEWFDSGPGPVGPAKHVISTP
jgi:hypothetical protein